MKRIVFSIIGIIFITSCGTSKKALIEADKHFETFEYDLAITSYKQSFNYDPSNEVAYKLAVSYLKKREFKEAEYWYTWYKQGGEMNTSNFYDLAEIYIGNSKFEDAKEALVDLANLDDNETASPKWQMLNKSVFQAKELLNLNSSYLLKPLESVNTVFSEFAYTQFRGQKYFISDRTSANVVEKDRNWDSKIYGWTGNGYLQVFKGDFDTLSMDVIGITAASEFSGELHFGPISLDSSYSFNTYTPKKEKASIGKWNDIIPKINFRNNSTGKIELIPSLPENFLTDPFWDPTSQRLYFSADFYGGFGNLDLYYSEYKSNEWKAPVNLGKRINSFGIERSPFISQDTLFFASDGLGGLGGLDIYKISLQEVEGDQPINMGVPFNSNKDDFFFFIDSELGGTQFLSSDRDGGMGMDDIYFISKIPDNLIRNIFVKVVDEETGASLENIAVEFQRQATSLNQNLITDRLGVANFNVNRLDSLINLKVYGSGYLNFGIKALDIRKLDTVFVSLQKLYLDTPIVFDDILYDFDKYTIRPSENESLIKLVSNLLVNPDLNVELRSHTDSRGSISYNQKLSEKRSESVENFLIQGGVAKSRIFVRSFGESFPFVNCGENCSLSDHQRNRRTEIVFFYGGFKNQPYTYPSLSLIRRAAVSVDSSSLVPLISNNLNEEDSQESKIEDEISNAIDSEINVSYYYLIVGSFEALYLAQEKAEELSSLLGINTFIISPMDFRNRYRVAVERFTTSKAASDRKEYFKRKLKRNDVWILFLETEDSLVNDNMDSL